MKRWLLNIFTGLSLLLCLATVGLWVRSYWYVDVFGVGAWKDRPHLRLTMYDACTTCGGLQITATHLRFFDESRTPNAVRDYFAHNFWAVDCSINARNGEYSNPKSAAEESEADLLSGFGVSCRINTFLGFGFRQAPRFLLWKDTAEKSATFIIMPIWGVVIIAAVIPVLWGIGFQRRYSRRQLGCCLQCGYDLRAHQPGQKCPECGTPVSARIRGNTSPPLVPPTL